MKNRFKFRVFLSFFICLIFSFGLISQSMVSKTLPDLGMYGFLKLGKFKKEVKWGRTIVLTPADATLISNGKPAFEVYYAYREFQGVPASGFKNKVYFNNKVVSIQSSLSLKPKEIKHVHTQAYLGPNNGKLEIHIDDENNIRESREDNNFHFFVYLKFRGFQSTGRKLPDLIVKDIRLVQNCKIAVTVKNIGTAGVPASYYNLPNAVGIQMYKNSKPWGGLILKGFDPAGKLKVPGGSATYIWFPKAANLNLPTGFSTIKVVADSNKNMPELSETNNVLTKRLNCRKLTLATTVKPQVLTIAGKVKRFFVDFKNAYLVYVPKYKSIQVVFDKNVVTYGGDWEKCNMKPYLYHLRQKVWKGFYWKINTSRKEAYRVTGGSFCKLGGKEQKLQMSVRVIGGSDKVAPDRFLLQFPQAYMAYVPSSKIMQFVTEANVLNYGTDWQRCNLSSTVYHFKQKFMKTFFWAVKTNIKKAYRVKGNFFCKSGGTYSPLNATVRVVY